MANPLQKSNFFPFIAHAVCVLAKKPLPNPRSQIFSPLFSSKSFVVLGFTFRSVIHCFIWYKVWIKVHFFLYKYLAVSASIKRLLFNTSFIAKNYLGLFAENQLTMYLGIYIWILYSVALIYMPIHLPVPHCLDYSSFVVKFWNQTVWALQLCSFSKKFYYPIYWLFSQF